MRKTLLASAAILGVTSGLAVAQNAPNPSQGQYVGPLLGGPSPNNNNNAWGTAQKGGVATPTPGTVVIHLNGKVYSEVDLSYGTLMKAPPGAFSATSAGFKMNPVGVAAYLRLYPGIDGMSTNGIRYGASAEIRQNFMGGDTFSASTTQTATSGSAAGASGNSSSQTMFVRRAFTYIGSDQTGIVRLGVADGLVSLFDSSGTFTSGGWDGGIGNILNAGVQAVTPNSYLLSWAFLSGNGQEYDNAKIVYLSPQFFGFDFGVEYGPNQGNSFSNSATSSPYQTGPCTVASANCIGLSSGNDSTRWINRVAVGARYGGDFNGFGLKGYVVYIASGKESAPPAATKYDGLNMVNGGIALSYMGFTLNADASTGRSNGTNGLAPTGGAPETGVLVGLSYANGPFSVGADMAWVDSQGSAALVKISQRHEFAFAVGGAYKLAPGLTVALEYQYLQKHQGSLNFLTGATGTTAYNDIKVQGLTLATIVNW